MNSRFLRLLVALAALGHGSARATTWYVNQDAGNDVNAGTLARPFETIGRAVLAARSGDTVLVPNGTYAGYDNRNMDFGGKDIILVSTGGAQNCIIDCERFGRALVFDSGETAAATVDGFTIRNGTPPDPLSAQGGAVLIHNSSPTFRNCIFSGNGPWSGKYETTSDGAVSGGAFTIDNSHSAFTACTFQQNSTIGANTLGQGYGGAVYATDCDLSLTDCSFDGNAVHQSTSATYPAYGGGLAARGGAIVLTRCGFTNNVGTSVLDAYGGAVYVNDAQADMTDSSFSGNQSYGPGGAVCADASPTTLTNCTFSGNVGQNLGGGAAFLNGSDGRVTRCVFTNNQATSGGSGGGVAVTQSSATVDRTIFHSNSAVGNYDASGGGVFVGGGSLSLTNCELASNLCHSDGALVDSLGGGIENSGGTLTLVHCTLTLNTASAAEPRQFAFAGGGGCFTDGGTTTMRNSVVYGNSARDAYPNIGQFTSSTDTTVAVTYSDIGGGFTGTGNINADPLFVSASDFHLQSASPARDTAAAFEGIPPTDLDGLPRIMGPAPDMGAYEVLSKAWFVDKATGQDTNPGTPTAPFKTVTKALSVATNNGTVAVRAANYGTDRPSITRPVHVLNWGGIGAARIGAP